jgi:hypothetical protein
MKPPRDHPDDLLHKIVWAKTTVSMPMRTPSGRPFELPKGTRYCRTCGFVPGYDMLEYDPTTAKTRAVHDVADSALALLYPSEPFKETATITVGTEALGSLQEAIKVYEHVPDYDVVELNPTKAKNVAIHDVAAWSRALLFPHEPPTETTTITIHVEAFRSLQDSIKTYEHAMTGALSREEQQRRHGLAPIGTLIPLARSPLDAERKRKMKPRR